MQMHSMGRGTCQMKFVELFVWTSLILLLVINVITTVALLRSKKVIAIPKPMLIVGIWILPIFGAIIAILKISGKDPMDPGGPFDNPNIPGL